MQLQRKLTSTLTDLTSYIDELIKENEELKAEIERLKSENELDEQLSIEDVCVDFSVTSPELKDKCREVARKNGYDVKEDDYIYDFKYFRYSKINYEFDTYNTSRGNSLITADEFIKLFDKN